MSNDPEIVIEEEKIIQAGIRNQVHEDHCDDFSRTAVS